MTASAANVGGEGLPGSGSGSGSKSGSILTPRGQEVSSKRKNSDLLSLHSNPTMLCSHKLNVYLVRSIDGTPAS